MQAQIAPAPDDPQPLGEEEIEEKEQLLSEGFSNWNRRDFNAFVRACEKVLLCAALAFITCEMRSTLLEGFVMVKVSISAFCGGLHDCMALNTNVYVAAVRAQLAGGDHAGGGRQDRGGGQHLQQDLLEALQGAVRLGARHQEHRCVLQLTVLVPLQPVMLYLHTVCQSLSGEE